MARKALEQAWCSPAKVAPASFGGIKKDSFASRHEHGSRNHLVEALKAARIPSYLRWKRAIDLICVLMLLPMSVLIGLLIHCWIITVSPGPSIFRQARIGRFGKAFTIYKFRTMVPRAETTVYESYITNLIRNGKPLVKMDDEDERLIKGAKFLRKSGLDELPQLLNVLRGEMSIVGPRPCTPCEFRFFDRRHVRRFSVPAGLTGTWQIRRNRMTTFQEMMDMDVEYVNHLSFLEDLRIVMMTPLAVLATALAGTNRRRSQDQAVSPADGGTTQRFTV